MSICGDRSGPMQFTLVLFWMRGAFTVIALRVSIPLSEQFCGRLVPVQEGRRLSVCPLHPRAVAIRLLQTHHVDPGYALRMGRSYSTAKGTPRQSLKN